MPQRAQQLHYNSEAGGVYLREIVRCEVKRVASQVLGLSSSTVYLLRQHLGLIIRSMISEGESWKWTSFKDAFLAAMLITQPAPINVDW